jgi:pfkB family carbohydrate kinase/nucleoside 2-deoxyribosyltransferase-like protein
VIVLGGIYRERCLFPAADDIVGSGLRGAALLRSVCPNIRLVGAVDATTKAAADAVIGGLELDAELVERNEPVEFSYFTPLSTPALNGGRSHAAAITVEDDAAMVFRMVERAELRVRAERVVLDPQQPRDLEPIDLDWIERDALAIVANRSETATLGDATPDRPLEGEQLVQAARRILDRYRAEVVVVKRGAQGAVVVTTGDAVDVGPFPTMHVYPIGSGDAFASAFAWAWAVDRRDPVEAARTASRVAAEWCAHARLTIPTETFAVPETTGELSPRPCRVYVAAPFFSLAERWLVELVRDALRSLGATVFSPCHDVGSGGDEVARADIKGLEGCESVLALLDGDDPGTIFEAGWAGARDIPVVAFAREPDAEGGKMLRGTGAELHNDLSTAVYRSIWLGMSPA